MVRGDPSGMWNLQRGTGIVRISGFPRGNLRFFHRDALVVERYVIGVGIACCVEIGCRRSRLFQLGVVALSVERHFKVKRGVHFLWENDDLRSGGTAQLHGNRRIGNSGYSSCSGSRVECAFMLQSLQRVAGRFRFVENEAVAWLEGEFDAVTLNGRNHMIEPVSSFDFSKAQVAMFLCPPDESKRLCDKATEAGCIVIDNSRRFSGDDNVPLVLPELNPYTVKEALERKVVIPPASVSAELALSLSVLHDEFGVARAQVTALESVSEHGRAGTETLAAKAATQLMRK